MISLIHRLLRSLTPLFRLWPLGIVLSLTLFPFGWLGEVWPAFGLWLGSVFNTVLAHAIGHFIIFLLLGSIVLSVFPVLVRRSRLYIALVIWAGVAQELIQLGYKQRSLVFDDFWDLFIDLLALVTAYGLSWLWQRRLKQQT